MRPELPCGWLRAGAARRTSPGRAGWPSPSEAALRGEHAGDPRVEARGLGECPPYRLEHGLGDVVKVLAVMHVDVQGDLGAHGEGAEELHEQIKVEVRHARPRDRHVEHEER